MKDRTPKSKRTRKSRAAGAAMNVATVAAGAAIGHVAVKVTQKAAHIIAEEAMQFGLDKAFEHGVETVAEVVKGKVDRERE